MSRSDELTLQRLVDGRLSIAEIQCLIQEAERIPERWSQIACAFIEDQLWERSGKALAGHVIAPSADNHGGLSERRNSLAEAVAQTSSATGPHPSRFGSAGGVSAWNTSRPQLWVAAAVLWCLLLPGAFWAGRVTFHSATGGASEGAVKTPQAGVPSTGDPIGRNPALAQRQNSLREEERGAASDSPPLQTVDQQLPRIQAPFAVQWPSGSRPRTTPAIWESTAREIGYQPQPRQIPVELQQRLNRQGYQLSPQIQYLVGQTVDGHEVIVPVELMDVVPFGQ